MRRALILLLMLAVGSLASAGQSTWIKSQPDPVPSFSRSSIAYLDGKESGANGLRYQLFALPSTTDGAFPAAAGESSEHIKVMTKNSTYIFGLGLTSNLVYRSTDGVTWTKTANTQIISRSLYAVGETILLGFATSTGADPTYGTKAWYSLNNGTSFTEATFNTARTATSIIDTWCVRHNGSTIIICEYGAASQLGGRYIYRSVDGGKTYTKTFDLNDENPDGYHFHTVAYHAASGRWVACYGDTMAVRGVLVSTSDGVSWSNLHTVGNFMDQPVCGLDVGDPTRLLVGCDGPTTLGWLDVTTGILSPINLPSDPRANRSYCYSLGYYAGVYYAGGFDNSASSPAPVIWVSTDLVNWSVYHKFLVADTVIGCHQFIGGFGGKVHFLLQFTPSVPTFRTFSISPATVRTVAGTLIEPAVTNLTTLAQSNNESSVVWGVSSARTTVAKSDQYVGNFVGDYGVKIAGTTDADPLSVTASGPSITLGDASVAKKYIIQFRIKADAPIGCTVTLYRYSSTGKTLSTAAVANKGSGKIGITLAAHGYPVASSITLTGSSYDGTYTVDATTTTDEIVVAATYGASTTNGTVKYAAGNMNTGNNSLYVVGTGWQWIRSRPFDLVAGDVAVFKPYVILSQGSLKCVAYLDCLQVMEPPLTEWMIGGTTKVADLLTETVNADFAWTDLFAVQTLGQLDHYTAAANLYIKTWKVGSDALCLYYNPTDSKFYIQRNSETAVASAAQAWHPNQVIKFALRANSAGLTLDIQDGRAVERITDSALAALLNASVTMIYGDASSANQFPGRYADGLLDDSISGVSKNLLGMIPFKLTDADVAAAFNLAPTVVAQ